ncbi:TPA: RepB family plasmid replication initiator protein [Vibrio vulnificus]|nr:RepB family plasmid replication initiator protein [Vibrio vulnificus]HDY7597226.1 RepB family plasmid replication initiator protein [Vibrio vulnificus]
MSTRPLSHYDFLSNQTLALPTELLQVGFFRNNAEQNIDVITHNLSQQRYDLDELYCDTFVEILLFSLLLVEHHNYYLNSSNDENDECVILSLDKGSKIFKQLKLKGNFTHSQLIEKIENFIERFKKVEFFVNDEPVTIFEWLFINRFDNTLRFELHDEFIDYMNEREHSLTFIQKSDFVAIKRKNQIPIFLIIQSFRGLDAPFFTKSYISNILGIKGDLNKKLSVSFEKLKEKHVLEYEKELCHLPGIPKPFSRFNIKSVDNGFLAKMREDEAKAPKQRSKPTQKQNIQESEPEAHEAKTAANSAVFEADNATHTNVVCFTTFKQKKVTKQTATAEVEEALDLDLDELDEAWVLAVSDENTVACRTVNGALSLCDKSKTTNEMMILTPEIISKSKIKPFIFQE